MPQKGVTVIEVVDRAFTLAAEVVPSRSRPRSAHRPVPRGGERTMLEHLNHDATDVWPQTTCLRMASGQIAQLFRWLIRRL